MTDFHNYTTPSEGRTDWHIPINENFRQIDRDVEIRDQESNLDQYEAKDGAKFLAVDTGRTFLGDGDDWRVLPKVAGAKTPDIVCYEVDKASYAETQRNTFSGTDVFDAAQKAIDDQLSNTGDHANLSISFKPGRYVINSRLELRGDQVKGADRIAIYGERGSMDSAYFVTSELSGGTMLTIDPDSGDVPDDRIFGVYLANLNFDGRDREDTETGGGAGSSDRNDNGMYINDVRNLHIERVGLQGYRRGLSIRHIYQGLIDYLLCRTCGSDSYNDPAILIETGRTTSTKDWWDNKVHNAVNHVQFRHLQGNKIEGPGHVQLSTPTVDGETPRIRTLGFLHPNVECFGETWLHTHANANVLVGDCQIQSPDVGIDQDGGRVVINGGLIESPGKLIDSKGGHTIITGVDVTSSDATDAIVDVNAAWLNISNLRTYGGQRAVRATGPNGVSISGLYAQMTEEAAVRITDGTHIALNNIVIKDGNTVDDHSENPIWIKNNDATAISNVVASVNGNVSPRAVIRDNSNTGPLAYNNIVPAGNVSGIINAHADTEFIQWKGTAVVPSGSTSTAVEHKLAATPDSGGISVTPNTPLGNATSWYVSDVGSTTFDIHLNKDPSRDVRFVWQASL